MRVLIATGGTGGHIYPALQLADEIKREDPSSAVLFIGNTDRMEHILIPQRGYDFFGIRAKGFNGNSSYKVKSILLMMESLGQCRKKIKEFKPDIVVGFGGYVTVPVILAAKQCHIPTVLHEQNSVPGMANKFLSRFADKVVICYNEVKEAFDSSKVELLGNPRASVAKTIVRDRNILSQYQLDPNKKTVFIVMGSLGSSSVNEVMKDVLVQARGKEYQIIYVTGRDGYDEFVQDWQACDNICILPYADQATLVANCDLVISRGGATSAAEITALQIPSIIIPSPYVPNNHQFLNAKAMLDAGCAMLLEEKDMSVDHVMDMMESCLFNEEKLTQMSKCAQTLGFANAAEDIVALLHNMIGD